MTPSVAHFVCLEPTLPWLSHLALRTAAQVGGVERIVLHHSEPLVGSESDAADDAHWAQTRQIPGLELRPLNVHELLGSLFDKAPNVGPALQQIAAELDDPRGLSDLTRVALLYQHGGVFLDLHSLTLRDMSDLLLRSDFFCIEAPQAERATGPTTASIPQRVATELGAVARGGAAAALRRIPQGWRAFSKAHAAFPTQASNAVMGCPAKHPFALKLLQAIAAVPVTERRSPGALGAQLLDAQRRAWDATGLLVYAPELFTALGPAMADHWFRPSPARAGRGARQRAIGDDAMFLHWGSNDPAALSARHGIANIDPAWVRAHRDTPIAALILDRGWDPTA